MTTDDDNLDLVEEIYLTEEQYICWMRVDTPRPDIFGTREGQVVLKDMLPVKETKQPRSLLCKLGPLAEAALGPGWKRCEVQPAAPSSPVPVRKLERPADAVWTFFCHNCMVIGVHDDGTVVGRFTLWWPQNLEYCVTSDGTFYYHNEMVGRQDFVNGSAGDIAKHLQGALEKWVKRAKGRKMPPGIQRLINSTMAARNTWSFASW